MAVGARPLPGAEPGYNVTFPSRHLRNAHILIDAADAPHYAQHPALLVQTTVDLPNVDVRQASTSLRAMMTDTTTQTLLPMGHSSMIIAGTGRHVANMVAMLRDIDERQGRMRAEAEKKRTNPPTTK